VADFAALLEPHRNELRLHCYRMLGSFEEAEDLVQETFLRAWRARASFSTGSLRAWLYRIATNACLDVLRQRPPRLLVGLGPAADPDAPVPPPAELPWLQPFPDQLLDDDPTTAVVNRETIELAFMAAIQHLPPRQRAVLILRDVVGWSAKETADLLDASVSSVNSALQRARATMREKLPPRRTDWAPAERPSDEERELLARYLDAHHRGDNAALAELLREDARLTMPPHEVWFDGREAILVASAKGFTPEFGDLRSVATAANRQPAVAHYLRAPGESDYAALAFDVVRVEDGRIVEINSFVFPQLFPAFGLPMSFRDEPRSR
jgi:RNA polymerase sigma-70 factor (ECF subfamily)